MRGIAASVGFAVIVIALAVGAAFAQQTDPTIFHDNFEPTISGSVWSLGPLGWGGPDGWSRLTDQSNHIRTPGVNGAREWATYRTPNNSMHLLPAPYNGNVYLKCWIFEDNDIPWPFLVQ